MQLEKYLYFTRVAPRCQAITKDTDLKIGSQCSRSGKHEFEGSWFCTLHLKKELEMWRKGRHHLQKKVTQEEFDAMCKVAHKTVFDLASEQQEKFL